jgi:hypothetical protein
MGYPVDNPDIGFAVGSREDFGEQSGIILFGEFDAVGIYEPVEISPFN